MKTNENFETEPGSTFNSPRFHMNEVLAKFTQALTRNDQNNLFSEEVIITLSDPNWFIRQNYHDQQWMQIFRFIDQSYCRRLFILQTGVCNVIQQISRIKFTCLKQIDLSNNNINNVEIISFLKIPNVKNIVLKNNCIVNINALRRGRWKNIEVLDIENNFVIEWKRIHEIQITKHLIEYFSIEFVQSENLPDVEDISRLYPKLKWNSKTEQIDSKIELFGRSQTGNLHQVNLNFIKLGNKRYEALKRKFSQINQ